MKILVIVSLFFLGPWAQAATKSQLQDIKAAAIEIMIENGAESELSPEVTKLQIISENSEFAQIKFSGIEWGPYEYNCTFTYSYQQKAVVSNSASCR